MKMYSLCTSAQSKIVNFKESKEAITKQKDYCIKEMKKKTRKDILLNIKEGWKI